MKYLIIYPLAGNYLIGFLVFIGGWCMHRYHYDYALDSKFKFNGKFIQFWGGCHKNRPRELYQGELSTLQTIKGIYSYR